MKYKVIFEKIIKPTFFDEYLFIMNYVIQINN